jgi:hypothetical protein
MKHWALAMGCVVAAASWGCGRVSQTHDACQDCGTGGSTPGRDPGKALPGTTTGGTSSLLGPVGAGSGGGAAAPSVSPFDPQCDEPLEFKSECSFEETCKLLGCGDGLSGFGDDGCRHLCENSSDCAKGERCRFTILSTDCGPGSVVEECVLEPDGCACGGSADCSFPDICVDEARYPEAEDCALVDASCGDLQTRQRRLDLPQAALSDEKSSAVWACLVAIHDRQVALACPGVFAPKCTDPLEFKSQCSFEDTCKALDCGGGLSEFGADGCRRLCTTSADCGNGERCRHTLLVTNEEECITGGDFEDLYYEDGVCQGEQNASCEFPDVCVDAAKYPPSQDCVLEGASCQALAFLNENVAWLVAHPTLDPSAVPFAIACQKSVKDKQAALGCLE